MPHSLPRFTLVQIHYFTEIARLGNMTAAAERLRVTQPTLSAAIKQLESSLGAKLFVRTGQNRLQLTAAGRSVFFEAKRLMRLADHVAEQASGADGEITGELVVGMFSPIAPFRAPKILKEFSQLHPGVSLSFVDGNLSVLQRLLLDGTCDVAVMYRLDLDPRIVTAVLDRVSPYVLLPAHHRLAQQPGEVRIQDLSDEPYIMLDLPHTREHYLGLFGWAGIEPDIPFRLDSFESVRSFVGAGHGYTILHQGWGLRHTYSGGEVVARRIQGGPPQLEIVLGAMSETMQTQRAQAFSRVARTIFAQTPS